MESSSLRWQAPEFEYHEKGVGWYWLSIIVAVIILAVAVWQRNFLFGVFVVIAEILILVWGEREPQLVDFELTTKSLTIYNKKSYPLTDFSQFSVDDIEVGEWARISFHSVRRFRPALVVLAPRADLSEIVEHLQALIPETPWEESFIDTLGRLIRF